MSEFPHSTPSAMFPGASIAIKCRLLQNYFTAVVRSAQTQDEIRDADTVADDASSQGLADDRELI